MPPLLKAYSGHEERARTLSTSGKVHAHLNAEMISKQKLSEFYTPFDSTGIVVVDSRLFLISDWLLFLSVATVSQGAAGSYSWRRV